MREHRLAVAAHLVAVTAITALALTACTASPPRSSPDEVEKASVRAATFRSVIDRVSVPTGTWTQLWTPSSGGSRIATCVDTESGGVVSFHPDPVASSQTSLSYGVEVQNPFSPLFPPGASTDDSEGVRAERIVDACLARYPIDYRLGYVTVAEADALYAYDQTILRRCLIAHGQQVARLPDRARFVNLLKASVPWNGYDQVVVRDRAAWYALADACPALPPAIAGDVAALSSAATTP